MIKKPYLPIAVKTLKVSVSYMHLRDNESSAFYVR